MERLGGLECGKKMSLEWFFLIAFVVVACIWHVINSIIDLKDRK